MTENDKTEGELYYERLKREYLPLDSSIISSLEMFASEDPQQEKWYNTFFDSYLFSDWLIDFDYYCNLLLQEVRAGIVTCIDCRAVKQIIRVHYLYKMMERRTLDEVREGLEEPKDYKEINRRLVTHPAWLEVAVEARKALEMIRRRD